MSYEDKIEDMIKQEDSFSMKNDPFEATKQKLRDSKETIYANPLKPYIDISLPKSGKVGEYYVIKFSEKAPKVEVAVSQDIQWKRADKYDRQSKPELICKPFILESFKNVKEVKVLLADMGIFAGKPKNFMPAGEYMIEARAWSTGSGQETNVKMLINITKDK